MAKNVLVKIDEQMNGKKVVIYMLGMLDSPQYGFSAHTVEILQSCGYPFETVDVLEDTALRDGIRQYSTWPTISQVFTKESLSGAAISSTRFMRGVNLLLCSNRPFRSLKVSTP